MTTYVLIEYDYHHQHEKLIGVFLDLDSAKLTAQDIHLAVIYRAVIGELAVKLLEKDYNGDWK